MNKEIERRIAILGAIAVLLIVGGNVVSLVIRGMITITDTLAWYIIIASIVLGLVGIYNLVKLWILFKNK